MSSKIACSFCTFSCLALQFVRRLCASFTARSASLGASRCWIALSRLRVILSITDVGANLTTPRAVQQGQDAKYSVTLLIPKTDTATKANIDASIEAAAQDAQGKLWSGIRPPVLPTPLHDGDGVRENGTPYGPECKGCWVMTASTKNKPQVVHQSDVNTELAPQDIYSGMYARVTVNFFPYDASGNRGVGCSLGNVCKTRDGEPLGGRANAESDFAGLEQAAPQQPQNYAAPQQGVNPLTGQPW